MLSNFKALHETNDGTSKLSSLCRITLKICVIECACIADCLNFRIEARDPGIGVDNHKIPALKNGLGFFSSGPYNTSCAAWCASIGECTSTF